MRTRKTKRMAAEYAPGTVRVRRWYGLDDVRGYVPPRGWTAVAELLDVHPISGRTLEESVWWIVETRR